MQQRHAFRAHVSRLAAAVVLVLALAVLAASNPVRAVGATFNVDINLDGADKNPGDGICDQNLFLCTLRAAVMEANALPGHDTIILPAGTYVLTRAGAFEDAAVTGDLDITDDVTIQGVGAAATIIDGGGIDRVFHIDVPSAPVVAISGVTIRNGYTSPGDGGGIANGGHLTLSDSIVTANTANEGGGLANSSFLSILVVQDSQIVGNSVPFWGGGLQGAGTVIINNSLISGNTAGFGGGGVDSSFANVTIDGSTIAGNSAAANQGTDGGGILNPAGGTTTVTNSTISGNSADSGAGLSFRSGGALAGGVTVSNTTFSGNTASVAGGAVFMDPPAQEQIELTNVTISGNSAPNGGGVRNIGGAASLSMTNTIVSGNTASAGPDCSGSVTSSGRDIIQDTTGCTIGGVFNPFLLGLDPLLGPLANYGGATDVYPLRSHSPAVDAGDNGSCPTTDQRGGIRPQDGDDDGLSGCDIGAFELQPVCGGPGAVESPSDVAIPDNDPAGVNSTVGLIAPGLEIVDLNLCVAIPHTWVGDLIVTLTHVDTGTTATVIDRPGKTNDGFGCYGDDIFVLLDDEAGPPVENECDFLIPAIAGNFSPNNPLSVFDGEDISGDWMLTVSDNAGGDIGVLDRWDLLPQLIQVTPSPTQTAAPTPTPTPTPVGQTPSPTPTPIPGTPTPTATPVGQTPSPTPTPTPTPTATPVGQTLPPTLPPKGTPPAGESVVWGDHNCSGEPDPVDSLLTLRFDAGLSTNTGDCPDLGQVVDVQNASPHAWGDVDCGGDVTPVDSLKLLRYDAGLSVAQEAGCPLLGSQVTIVVS